MKADEVELVQTEKHIFFPVKTGRLVMPEDPASNRHRLLCKSNLNRRGIQNPEPMMNQDHRAPTLIRNYLKVHKNRTRQISQKRPRCNSKKTNQTTIG